MEDPGFPFTRRGLELARLSLTPIPVDADGIDVGHGSTMPRMPRWSVVTAGQQAPLGRTLSLARRLRLLDWAAQTQAWVIEDDYLSELQLNGRAAPALASLDRAGALPHRLLQQDHQPGVAARLSSSRRLRWHRVCGGRGLSCAAPGPAVQLATAEFMRGPLHAAFEAHEARLLSPTGRLAEMSSQCRGRAAVARFGRAAAPADGAPDVASHGKTLAIRDGPGTALRLVCVADSAKSGLLLGLATAPQRQLERSATLALDS